MTSGKKLSESKYFLSQVEANYNETEKSGYYLSAFLHSCYDIQGHTLEEYQEKYRLKMNPESFMDESAFLKAAEAKGNETAIKFLEFFILRLDMLVKNPISASLMAMRNRDTHRNVDLNPTGTLENDKFTGRHFLSNFSWEYGFPKDIMTPSEEYRAYVAYFIRGHFGNRKRNEARNRLGMDIVEVKPDELSSILSDGERILTDEDILNVCKNYLELWEKFVRTITGTFPNQPSWRL